jgi:hypothetical protein
MYPIEATDSYCSGREVSSVGPQRATGNWRLCVARERAATPATGNRQPATGNRQPATGNRQPATGNW